uniref:gliding motility-associated C-terminal domain-containing protein n=6 Tax=Gelidibacter sp. TaxID=2018083 RepID=UPI00404B24DB
MKKITFLLLFLFASSITFGQTSVDCTVGSITFDYCYANNNGNTNPDILTYTSSDGITPLNFTVNSGNVEWNTFGNSPYDPLIILDSDGTTQLYNGGGNLGNLAGISVQSTGPTISFYISSDISVTCDSSPDIDPMNVTVSCATCTNPVVDYEVRQDCLNGPQFYVDVDLTGLGSATSITLTDNQGSTPQTIGATGLYSFGPFNNGTGVIITVTNNTDTNCTLTSTSLTQDQCVLNQVDCASAPLNINYCYDDSDDTAWLFESTDGGPLRLTFNIGTMESCCDDIIVYDGADNTAPVLYVGNNGGNLAGLQFDSTGDSLYMEIDSDTSVSCQSDDATEWDFTVACATCVNPVADYAVRQDCSNGPQFFVDVDLTDLGSATSITLSDNQGSAPQTTSATGLFSFGPFANATDVVITVTNDDDANCSLVSTALTQEFCQDFIVDCSVGPQTLNYCYSDGGAFDPVIFTFTSNDGTPLNLTFNAGVIEQGWDELVVINTDGSFIVDPAEFFYGNNGDLTGLTYQSFGDTISFYINSDGIFSCETEGYEPIDVTVSCATCINPAATYTVVDDCDNGEQFLIDVNVTSLGDATSLTISNNIDATTVPVTAVGTYQTGPFPFLQDVIITITNDQDNSCDINSQAIQLLACPPDNDDCDSATVASVNTNDTCDLITSGTIIAATPSGVPDGCTGDPDDDVWFQFTALNEVQLISIINITGGTTNLDHALYSGSCGTLTEVYCSPNAASITPELVVGNTYFIRVFSFGSVDETSSFDLCIRRAPENTVCENSVNFCGSDGGLVTPSLIGIPSAGAVACLTSVQNPAWNIIQIGESGTINLQIAQNTQFDENGNPVGTELDVDYALWGPFTSLEDACGNLTLGCPTPADCPGIPYTPEFYPYENIIDCSWDPTGVEVATIDNAVAGEIYVLLTSNFDNLPGTVQITQTNAGNTGAGSTIADIEVDLGEDQNLCGFDELELVADSPFADRYEWYEDGFIIENETGSTLTVTNSNIYTVIAYDDNCDAQAIDEVAINFYLEPIANPVADIVTCDDASGDNFENFDLDAQTPSVLGTQNPADFAVTYHSSLANAQAGTGALSSPYTNITNPQTIYVRVEDVDAVGLTTGCFATTSFDLVISGPTPNAVSENIVVCDDDSNDGVEAFDLEAHDSIVLGGQDDTQFTVSYYASEADANAGDSPLASPHTNTASPGTQTIWVRVESNIAFDCYSVVDFDLIVSPAPSATFNTEVVDYEVCPNATVPIEISLIPNGFTATDVTVQWTHDGGSIAGESGLTLPVLEQGIYEATIVFNGAPYCDFVVSETVIELESCVIPQGISPNNDGANDTFDVSSYDVSRLEIFNRNGTLVYSKSNYSNEWFGQTNDGDELPVGTYFYSMIYQGGKEKTGWVYINR